jgi:PPOX class probable F420-dependent enzyme
VIYTDEQREFLESHRWAVLATGRQDGSPQQSMVGYTMDGEGRILISSQTFTAKVRNTRRLPRVSLTVPDGRVHVAVYGTAEIIENDPERAELSADVLAVVRGPDRPDPAAIVPWLDQQQRIVVRITPERVFSHE